MNKRNSATALIFAVALLQGCSQATLEKAIALGDNPEPGSLTGSAMANQQSASPETCELLVLNNYCLGEKIQDLLELREPVAHRELNSAHQFDFRDKYHLTTLTVYEQKIMSVSRLNRLPKWTYFHALKRQLEHNYGKGEDQSYYPSSAETPKRQKRAIFARQGAAQYLWDKEEFQIILRWHGLEPIELTFLNKGLNQAYAETH